MVSVVEKLWNSLRKSLGNFCGMFCTGFINCGFFDGFWWNSVCFSQVFQKFCAGFNFKNTPIFCDKLGGFTHFPQSLLLLLI